MRRSRDVEAFSNSNEGKENRKKALILEELINKDPYCRFKIQIEQIIATLFRNNEVKNTTAQILKNIKEFYPEMIELLPKLKEIL